MSDRMPTAEIVIRTLLVLAGFFLLAWLCSACGGSAGGECEANAPMLCQRFECGRLYTGLYGTSTYGIDNSLEAKCQGLGGECLPVDSVQANSPVVCTVSAINH